MLGSNLPWGVAMIRQALWDQRMIDELKKKRERLFSERSSPRLLAELRRRLQSTTRDIYMVRSIAEQVKI
jgi:hypothetical protein